MYNVFFQQKFATFVSLVKSKTKNITNGKWVLIFHFSSPIQFKNKVIKNLSFFWNVR